MTAGPAGAPEILRRLAKLYPDPHTALNYSNDIELMTAVILSAQCTDERVNAVTAELFKNYQTAADYASSDPGRFEREIKPTGFFRQKTKSILGACAKIDRDYGGKIPKSMEDMLTLPGIGRKSANIILSEIYGLQTGIPVDTHVKRLSYRLGLTGKTDPDKIEADLMPQLPPADWYRFSSVLIFHGRSVCKAGKPRCDQCVLSDICPSADLYS